MVADHKKVTRLLKTARGQLDGLLKMVEDYRYCIDISTQISATQAILKKANEEILTGHLHGCVREAFESGDEREKDQKIEEIITILRKIS